MGWDQGEAEVNCSRVNAERGVGTGYGYDQIQS